MRTNFIHMEKCNNAWNTRAAAVAVAVSYLKPVAKKKNLPAQKSLQVWFYFLSHDSTIIKLHNIQMWHVSCCINFMLHIFYSLFQVFWSFRKKFSWISLCKCGEKNITYIFINEYKYILELTLNIFIYFRNGFFLCRTCNVGKLLYASWTAQPKLESQIKLEIWLRLQTPNAMWKYIWECL